LLQCMRPFVMLLLSNRCWGVKHIISQDTLPGAWLSSRSTLAAA